MAILSVFWAATSWRLYFRPIDLGSIAGTVRSFPWNPINMGLGVALMVFLLSLAWRSGNGFARRFWFVMAAWLASEWFLNDRASGTVRLLTAVADSAVAGVFSALVVCHVRRPFELYQGWLSADHVALAEREAPDTRRAAWWGYATPVLGLPLAAVMAVPFPPTSNELATVLMADLLLSVVCSLAAMSVGLWTRGDRSSPAGENLVAYGSACLVALFGFFLLGSQVSLWIGLLG